MWDALSDERIGLWFIIAAGLRQRILGSESRGTHGHILPSQFRESPNLEGQLLVRVYTSLRNRVAPLYFQELGSLFVASYDSQGYGGDRRIQLHAEETPFVKSKKSYVLVSSTHL
jgi:hypothetical protein